jgi:hypothetical protein
MTLDQLITRIVTHHGAVITIKQDPDPTLLFVAVVKLKPHIHLITREEDIQTALELHHRELDSYERLLPPTD